jgi:serine/threonine-protein phosphatase 6 regulatory subunit 3
VFCCEVEAVFNTLLEDETLLALLFSLLEQQPPLSCKAAGYFGRVVGQLLLRKTNEMMQYLSNNDALLERLVSNVGTTSIADIVKRLVGADDHSSMIFLPMHTQWLAETPLIDMLLARLGSEHSACEQANAADILTAIAHTQPSALAAQLMQQRCIDALFERALAPTSGVLVTTLDVCAALLEPCRSIADAGLEQSGSPGGTGDGGSAGASPRARGAPHREAAVAAILGYVPRLLEQLDDAAVPAEPQETPYGQLVPPLGSARLRIVELLAALLRVGAEPAELVLIGASALPRVQALFEAFPFNNLLHHQAYALLAAALQRCSTAMAAHVFGECALISWLAGLPKDVTPVPRPGSEGRGPLRAGYLGHVTRIGLLLQDAASEQQAVADALAACDAWGPFVAHQLTPQLELEDVMRWQCGRPTGAEGGELDSDAEEYQVPIECLARGGGCQQHARAGNMGSGNERRAPAWLACSVCRSNYVALLHMRSGPPVRPLCMTLDSPGCERDARVHASKQHLPLTHLHPLPPNTHTHTCCL